jgi:hypothetical protein
MAIKEKPKAPTNIRRRKLAEKLLENGGTSVSAAMREAGYSEAYSKNPQHITSTKSFREWVEYYLPDSLITEKHNALLNKIDPDTGDIDANAVKAGVDMAYKIKGNYAPEKMEHTITAVKIIKYGDNPTD